MYKKGETTRKLRQADIIYLSLSKRLSKSPLLCAFDPQIVIIALEYHCYHYHCCHSCGCIIYLTLI